MSRFGNISYGPFTWSQLKALQAVDTGLLSMWDSCKIVFVGEQSLVSPTLPSCWHHSLICPSLIGLFCRWIVGILYMFWVLTSYQIYVLHIFSCSVGCFSLCWLCPLMHRRFYFWCSSVYLLLLLLPMLLVSVLHFYNLSILIGQDWRRKELSCTLIHIWGNSHFSV